MGISEQMGVNKWQSVMVENSEFSLTAQERADRFRLEALTEITLRVFGILMIAAAFLLWILMSGQSVIEIGVSTGVMVAVLAATGLVIFAYGTRGFRRQMRFDRKRGTLSMTKVNINEQTRVERSIPVERIESMFIHRQAKNAATASLFVRIRGVFSPVCALSGDSDEIEALHRGLCTQMGGTAA